MVKTMLPLFMSSFQTQFNQMTDEDMDVFLTAARAKLDYIDKGE